jgi:hypothetical protein
MTDIALESVTETETHTVTRYRWATGAATFFTPKEPMPEYFARGVEFLRRTGAAGIARLEANADTDSDADALAFVWDSYWSVDQ